MSQKRKLQVFVSSTFKDLHEERQAAVEAILTAGHIPAGMELFTAGDESQMNVIKQWIDESDVFMLILGGRYGSIEPQKKKSYTHLEYEYALESGKPLFAVVITPKHLEESVKAKGIEVIETKEPVKLEEFRQFVCSKMVKFWDDPKDIKLAVMETMAEFGKRSDLYGWVRESDSIDSGPIAQELARLAKENSILREQAANSTIKYSGLTYQEMCEQLSRTKATSDEIAFFGDENVKEVVEIFGSVECTILHSFWFLSGHLLSPRGAMGKNKVIESLRKLAVFGLVNEDQKNGSLSFFRLTQTGREFLLRLRMKPDLEKAEKYILL